MLTHKKIDEGRIIEFTIDGAIGRDEFDKLIGCLEKGIATHGEIRVLEHVRSLGKMPLEAVMADFRFAAQHMAQISHAAVVSDLKWVGLIAKGAASLFPGRLKVFAESDIEDARYWLQHEPAGNANIEKIFAHVSCHDLATSAEWYGKVLGRDADEKPMHGLLEWHLGEHAGLQLFEDPEKAGNSTVTLFTENLNGALQRIVDDGLRARETEQGSHQRLARLTDPDGNLVVLVQQTAALQAAA